MLYRCHAVVNFAGRTPGVHTLPTWYLWETCLYTECARQLYDVGPTVQFVTGGQGGPLSQKRVNQLYRWTTTLAYLNVVFRNLKVYRTPTVCLIK